MHTSCGVRLFAARRHSLHVPLTYTGRMNLRSPHIVTRVTHTAQLSARDWDDIWLLTSEFYDVEREFSEGIRQLLSAF